MGTNDNLLKKITTHINSGGVVQVTTHLVSTIYAKKHLSMFSQSTDGELFVSQGKRKVSLRYTDIRFGRYQ